MHVRRVAALAVAVFCTTAAIAADWVRAYRPPLPGIGSITALPQDRALLISAQSAFVIDRAGQVELARTFDGIAEVVRANAAGEVFLAYTSREPGATTTTIRVMKLDPKLNVQWTRQL